MDYVQVSTGTSLTMKKGLLGALTHGPFKYDYLKFIRLVFLICLQLISGICCKYQIEVIKIVDSSSYDERMFSMTVQSAFLEVTNSIPSDSRRTECFDAVNENQSIMPH